jgi:hypothetical protein
MYTFSNIRLEHHLVPLYPSLFTQILFALRQNISMNSAFQVVGMNQVMEWGDSDSSNEPRMEQSNDCNH